MIIREEQNTNKLACLWLECSLAAHSFIDPGYWKGNFAAMKETYLPAAANYSVRGETEGPILGFISFTDIPGGAHIEALFIGIPHQGKGIGSELIGFAKELYGRLTLRVFAKNGKAVKFYERHGFVAVATESDPATGEREIVMQYIPENETDRE